MEFKRKIYDYNVRKFALQILPVALRMPFFIALVRALLSPIEMLAARFTNFKKLVEYELTITPQVCYLQKMLNDFYDYSERRIVITEAELKEQPALYTKPEGEDRGLPMFTKAEGIAESYFVTRIERVAAGGYFIVQVPAGLNYNIDKMKGQINKYKLPTTIYQIIEI